MAFAGVQKAGTGSGLGFFILNVFAKSVFVQISDVKSLLDFGTKKSGVQTMQMELCISLHHEEVLTASLTMGLHLHEVAESRTTPPSPIETCLLRRVTAVTNMNAGSSRSHAVRTSFFCLR